MRVSIFLQIEFFQRFLLRRSTRTAANPGVFSGFVTYVNLVSMISAMLTLLLWRKVSSDIPLIPFAFHFISRRQLVGVGVEIDPEFISISPAH